MSTSTYIILLAVAAYIYLKAKSRADRHAEGGAPAGEDGGGGGRHRGDPDAPAGIYVSEEKEFHCELAGARHNCDGSDIGGFVGHVRPRPDNPPDPGARAIYRGSDNKLLGYIPAARLPEYHAWSGSDDNDCVGFVKKGDHAPLHGYVKVMTKASLREERLIATSYARWIVENHGLRYLPKDLFRIEGGGKPRTKAEWLAALDDYIARGGDT